MKRLVPAVFGLALTLAGASSALAGNGNLLYLSQQSDAGTIDANEFVSDQTWANYSSIGTVFVPAQQKGHGNQANLLVKSDCAAVSDPCGTVLLRQDNSSTSLLGTALSALSLGPLAANTAHVTITDEGNASVLQLGGGNLATLGIGGGDGSITQLGVGNTATLTLQGTADGAINQTGVGHVADLTVTTVGNGSVTLNQIGASRYYGPTTVATTSSVTITQFGF